MEVILDGDALRDIGDVHRTLARALDFGPYYGGNLPALWDRLSADVPRPVKVRWINSGASRSALAGDFDAIIEIVDRAEQQDSDFGLIDKFTYTLE